MHALITGIGGFVGRHLAAELSSHGHRVSGIDLVVPASPIIVAERVEAADIVDQAALTAIVEHTQPDVIVHLAGAASVGASFADPRAAWRVNLDGTLSVLEAVRRVSARSTVLCVTSAEVYGHVPGAELPATEHTPFRPHSPYAASKAAADIAALQYHSGFGLAVMTARPFNHIGPGQDARFVVPSIARQIALGERAGDDPIVVTVGNLQSRRDFMDVRDVVRAYRLIAERGRHGSAYVIGQGRSLAVQELLDGLVGLARGPVRVVSDPARRREGEPPDLYGSSERLRADTDWAPEIPLRQTLSDTLDWWRAQVAQEDL